MDLNEKINYFFDNIRLLSCKNQGPKHFQLKKILWVNFYDELWNFTLLFFFIVVSAYFVSIYPRITCNPFSIIVILIWIISLFLYNFFKISFSFIQRYEILLQEF